MTLIEIIGLNPVLPRGKDGITITITITKIILLLLLLLLLLILLILSINFIKFINKYYVLNSITSCNKR